MFLRVPKMDTWQGCDDLSLARPDPWGTTDRPQSQTPLSYSIAAPSAHKTDWPWVAAVLPPLPYVPGQPSNNLLIVVGRIHCSIEIVESSEFWGLARIFSLLTLRRNHSIFRIFQKGAAIPDHLKIQRKYNLNPFAPMHTLIRRLCPQPPTPYIIGKLWLSAFYMCY